MDRFQVHRCRTTGWRRLDIGWLLVVLSLMEIPFASAGTPEAPHQGGTIIVGIEAEATTLNPYLNTGTETLTPARNIFDQLVRADLDFTIKPLWSASNLSAMHSVLVDSPVCL